MSDEPEHSAEDFDPEHPDFQHEPPNPPETSEPSDTEEGEGETLGGELPQEIPDPPEHTAETEAVEPA